MHILTKIFAGLVALLSVALVPLVAVYVHNEESYRTRYLESAAKQKAMMKNIESVQSASQSQQARYESIVQEQSSRIAQLNEKIARSETSMTELRAGLRQAELQEDSSRMAYDALVKALQTNGTVNDRLIQDLNSLRSRGIELEKQYLKEKELLAQARSELEIETANRRAAQDGQRDLQSQIQNVQAKLDQYVFEYGDLNARPKEATVIADRRLIARITNVTRTAEESLAEVNIGTRDGVRKGLRMTIANGGQFLGTLRIIDVDVNRSVGVIELEDAQSGRVVQSGDRAYTIPGRS